MHLAHLAVAALVVLESCLLAECSAIPDIRSERSSLCRRGLYARQELESIDVSLNESTTQATILPLTLSSDRQ